MAYAKLSDMLNASEGEAYITINGQRRLLFEIAKLSAQLEYSVTEKRMLGNRMKQHKVTGIAGSGSMTMYFANSELLKQATDYINSGIYTEITIKVTNKDPKSTFGTSEVLLNNVIISSLLVAYLEGDSEDPITHDTDFTFDGIESMSSFTTPSIFKTN